jgi:isoquinoline 1-oxidoreductase beta subunit
MDISRRDFLKISFVAGTGLVVAIYLDGCKTPATPSGAPTSEGTDLAPNLTINPIPTAEPIATLSPNVFVTIGDDGVVTITQHRSEMGQGVRTALPMILADELGADWNMVRVEQALGDKKYGNQHTGGSLSVDTCYETLRTAGAVTRQLLVNAAAQSWNLQASDCYTENSLVIHRPTGKQLPFSELITLASSMPVPSRDEVKLKDPAEFKVIGKSLGRVDDSEILTGKAVYGMDVRLPGMLYATVACCPVIGGKVASYDDHATRQVPGVREVVAISSGIAVVAEGSWQAMQGKAALQVEWDPGPNVTINSQEAEQALLEQVSQYTPAADELVQHYTFSYFAHATMEPMNCTVDIRPDGCDIWVPTQDPQLALANASSFLKSSTSNIKVHVPLVGGGFGRRLEEGYSGSPPPAADYVRQALEIAQAVGAPIHLVWTRKDDFEHDLYHPLSITRVRARLDDINSLSMQSFNVFSRIPLGYWRSVTNPPEAFARESFLDEYAVTTGVDPVELRRNYLTSRAQAVVDKVAEMAGWGSPMPEGTARGIAHFAAWRSTNVAQVAEVSVNGTGIRVSRVFCAVDCGVAINPDMIVAQMEGGVVFGLSAALKEAMEFSNGTAMKTSFMDYPILRFDEMPQVDVQIIPSGQHPTGIGEMSNPVIAPAVANAVFALTGQRLRKLPLRLS